jgi:hypothetical protein
LLFCAVIAGAMLLPIGARAVASRYHDDSLWANTARSAGGLAVPYDFHIFLAAADLVRHGDSPYVDPSFVGGSAPEPYVYPPLLAVLVVPFTALPDDVAGSSPAAVLFSLLLLACTVGALLAIDVRDWRCYPVALLYPVTLENVELGAIGPILALLVALAWRYRDRVGVSGAAVGFGIVLKVFLWPLAIWLAATRRWRSALIACATALGVALASWGAIGFRGLADYPTLLRKLSDLEAENSYSAFGILRALDVPEFAARGIVIACGVVLLALAWRAARRNGRDRVDSDRRSLTLALAAAVVVTPILWLHYLVLLVIPIGLARPRLSALWFVPLVMTVFEALDWYRGWPRGDGRALASTAIVVGLVFAVSAWPRRSTPDARAAASPA